MLEVKTYKNYKELCSAIKWKVVSGNSKIKQFKELESMCKFNKEGQKIIIEEIFDIPKDIEDKRRYGGNLKDFGNFKVKKEFENNIGIYRIINYKTKEVYIGSTIRGFRTRFKEHNRGDTEYMYYTKELLNNGGVFEILESMNDCSEKEIRLKEQYYIDRYNENNNYILINNRYEVCYNGKKKHFVKIKIEDKYLDLATKLLNENGIEIY